MDRKRRGWYGSNPLSRMRQSGMHCSNRAMHLPKHNSLCIRRNGPRMRPMKTTLMTIALLSATSSAFAADWEIDASHSSAGFAVKHMMVSTVRGQFEKMSGTVSIDDKDPTKSSIEVVID